MHLARFQRRADHAVQPGGAGQLRVVHHHFGERLFNEQFLFHAHLVGAGQLRDGDEQRAGAVRAGQAFEGGLHHGDGAEGVEVGHVHVQLRERAHAALDGVGDVAELEIEENLVAAALDLAHDLRPFGVEKFHADLHEGLFAGEAVEEGKRFLAAGEVEGDDDVFTHGARLL